MADKNTENTISEYELMKSLQSDLLQLAKKYDLKVLTIGGMRLSDEEYENLKKQPVILIDHINLKQR